MFIRSFITFKDPPRGYDRMEISGTLHFYSGEDKELFFVFDDDVAQQLYKMGDFDVDDQTLAAHTFQ